VTWRQPLSARSIEPWLATSCTTGVNLWEHAGALYDSWRRYAQARGDEPGSPAEFAEQMEQRGFAVDRVPPVSRGRIRWGLRLR
jgi:phage/plasmid-associated DNA primase